MLGAMRPASPVASACPVPAPRFGLCAERLAPAVRARFAQLWAGLPADDAACWAHAPAGQAALLVLDATSPAPGPHAPCVLWVGSPSAPLPDAAWSTHLAPYAGPAQLAAALRSAAAFLARAGARHAPAPAGSILPWRPQRTARYQLAAWLVPGVPFQDAGCQRALALLARHALDLDQLCAASGLDLAIAHSLLTTLAQRGVLRVFEPVAFPPPAPPPAVSLAWAEQLGHWARAHSVEALAA